MSKGMGKGGIATGSAGGSAAGSVAGPARSEVTGSGHNALMKDDVLTGRHRLEELCQLLQGRHRRSTLVSSVGVA